MFFINRDLLNKKELIPKVEQATLDIGSCFFVQDSDSTVRVVLASYLLFEVSTMNNPTKISYKEMLSISCRFTEDATVVITSLVLEEEWSRLVALTEKYTYEVFALVSFVFPMIQGNKYKGMESTPLSITKLAQRILQITPSDRFADICCGVASCITECALDEPKANYYGIEINTSNKLIADIRTSLIDAEIKIVLQNAFSLLKQPETIKFDKIFSNYPFKIRLRNLGSEDEYINRLIDKYQGLGKATSSDWAFNALVCELLSNEGKAIGIMTNGSTWNSIDTPMRKQFVEEGLIKCVIALPPKIFEFTAISTSLVVFSKGNKSVRIVDASKLCQQGRRYNEFSDDDVNTIVSALRKDCEYSKAISVDELRTNDYTLSLSRYLSSNIQFDNAVPFESVIKSISRGAPCNARQLDEMASENATKMQYLMLSNIQNGIIEDTLPHLSHIDEKYKKYCLKDNDLILSKNGYPYKLAVAKVPEGHEILANGNLYIIELDQEKIDPYYLKAFFESEQGIAVLKSITVGATVPNIGVDSLKKVIIPVPPLAQQKRISEQYQMTLDEIAIHKLKLEKAFSKLHHIFDNESEG